MSQFLHLGDGLLSKVLYYALGKCRSFAQKPDCPSSLILHLGNVMPLFRSQTAQGPLLCTWGMSFLRSVARFSKVLYYALGISFLLLEAKLSKVLYYLLRGCHSFYQRPAVQVSLLYMHRSTERHLAGGAVTFLPKKL